MAVHFIHVGKTGGTAIKRTLRRAGLPETPFGPVVLHAGHTFRLKDVPADDHALFCIRDPIALFLSAFYSRLRKGQPRYFFEWTPAESEAFSRFQTPQMLASGLCSRDRALRAAAEQAMLGIRHTRALRRALGDHKRVRSMQHQIVYIARTESLDADWRHVMALLHLPDSATLPAGAKHSHRTDATVDLTLDETARAALTRWYAPEYRLVGLCDQIRADKGWSGEPAGSRTESM
ncbi:MAG: sulfotransferase family 2 domain-containing protein [Actinomycetes bacterium]